MLSVGRTIGLTRRGDAAQGRRAAGGGGDFGFAPAGDIAKEGDDQASFAGRKVMDSSDLRATAKLGTLRPWDRRRPAAI